MDVIHNNTTKKHTEVTMSKQTAVEWLDRWFRDNPEATHQEGNKALHQAKEMEKQQIIDALEYGWDNGHIHISILEDVEEKYYQETFKKDKL